MQKALRFFVYYEITEDVETRIIVPLAQTFKSSGYNLKSVITDLAVEPSFLRYG